MKKEALRAFHLSKKIHNKTVLDDINFFVRVGEFIGILGLEKAGKTCLFNILRGELQKDAGELQLTERSYFCASVSKAHEQGVFSIESNPKVIGAMTVGMYLYMFNMHRADRTWVSERRIFSEAAVILEKYGFKISPDEKLGRLSLQEWRLLELILIEIQHPKLVLLENVPFFEMISADKRIKSLFEKMKEHGTAFISFESSISENIMRLCNRAYLLKNGILSTELNISDIDEYKLRTLLTGGIQPASDVSEYKKEKFGAELLRTEEKGHTIVSLHEGEVLGAVLDEVWDDDSEFVFDFLYGKSRKLEVYKQGIMIKKATLETFQKNGIVIIPDPFAVPGVFSGLSMKNNIMEKKPGIPYKGPKRFTKREEEYIAKKVVNALEINTPNLNTAPKESYLNSEEMEKVWIGRWLWRKSEVFIFVNPFSLMDENGYSEMKKVFNMLTKQKKGIMVLSTTYKKMYDICDKVLEISAGK